MILKVNTKSVCFFKAVGSLSRYITKPRNSETKYRNSETPKRNTETSLFLHFFYWSTKFEKNGSFQCYRALTKKYSIGVFLIANLHKVNSTKTIKTRVTQFNKTNSYKVVNNWDIELRNSTWKTLTNCGPRRTRTRHASNACLVILQPSNKQTLQKCI